MTITITNQGKKLILFGAILFLVGLIQGGLIPFFTSPRMALSAHLAAVQSGMALMIFGVIWQLVHLKGKWLNITYWSALLSMYLIWLSITISAIFGASKALPIAGQGFSASYFVEMLVLIIVYIGAALGIASGVLFVCGVSRCIQTKGI